MSYIHPEFISFLAQTLEIDEISPKAMSLISKAAEYRLRSVIELSQRYMRRSHKSRLRASDVSHSLISLGIPSILSYPVTHKKLYENEEPVPILEILNEPIHQPKPVELVSHWLAIKGRVPNIPENHSEVSPPPSLPLEKDPAANIVHSLSFEQQVFLNKFQESLHQGFHFAKMLSGLSSDSSLTQLVPYMVNNIYTLLMESTDLDKNTRGVQIIQALAMNTHLSLEPSLHKVLACLLYTLIGKLFEDSEHWKVRDSTAITLVNVCQRYTLDYDSLTPSVLNELLKTLNDTTRSPESHYGALKALQAFGPESLCTLLARILPGYFNFVEEGFSGKQIAGWGTVMSVLIDCCKLLVDTYPYLYESIVDLCGEGVAKFDGLNY